jgi:hypothetical protein
MNDKLFNEIKLKIVMKIHGLSRRSAKEKIRKETSASYNNIGRDNDNLLTADDLFRS